MVPSASFGPNSSFVVNDALSVGFSDCCEVIIDVRSIDGELMFAVRVAEYDSLFVPLKSNGPLSGRGDVFLRLCRSGAKLEFTDFVSLGIVSVN